MAKLAQAARRKIAREKGTDMEHGKAEAPEQAAPAQAGAASGAGGAVLGALAALGVLAVGAGYWVLSSSTPSTQAPAPVAQMPAPVAEPVAEAAAPSATQAPPVAARFDQFRASPEGAITLAGHAEPGATVEVLLDGQVVDTVQALAGGSFASVVLAGPAATARSLSVRITGADGVARDGGEVLTVAPSPQAVAEAAAAAGAAPEVVAEQVAAVETAAAAPVVADAAGARVLAEASAVLVIDTLSYDAAANVALSGRGAPEAAHLRAYLNEAFVAEGTGTADGSWRMVLADVAPGRYSLRVDALDAAGKVLARAETPFERVAPALLAQAAPAVPAAEGEVAVSAAPAPVAAPPAAPPAVRLLTVQPGNTLWAIARETYGDGFLYVRVFSANQDQIRDPDLIYPGQVFTLPE
ncbi:LysM peptidoglycan-binding domain-containing protein [Paenirhodobacter sp. CAU 1674]|uniref:LysM peptidoglycan-binding domain-containing protein n=1 Tax=Paenirhodobacter sp. CAU 1674 TaxID=3032596 RepID=UPI0023DCBB47|nr:LysM peptidoglycan-binding domain-containing protein [Paenirhodobacter sp. CAU 1674]MDF2143074.1 Ig-like domain-containing protein [Paenirhodobacter sp. CAU 1674]